MIVADLAYQTVRPQGIECPVDSRYLFQFRFKRVERFPVFHAVVLPAGSLVCVRHKHLVERFGDAHYPVFRRDLQTTTPSRKGKTMKFEHFAINVPDAAAMARWYVQNCDLQPALALNEPPFTHFLADSSGRVVIEIYTNESAPMPDYAERDPLIFHWAFEVSDAGAARDLLLDEGAELVSDEVLDDGSHLVMLRDPWGIPLQLVNRAKPFD